MNKTANDIMKQALFNCADIIHAYCKQTTCDPNECVFCEYCPEPYIKCRLNSCPDIWRVNNDKES